MVLRKQLFALLFAVVLHSCTSLELDNPCDRRNGTPSPDCYLPSVGGGSSSSTNIPYINFIDDRDGKTYKSVVIGTQTWMAENLNYRIPGGASRCYPTSGNTNSSDNDNANCDTYGRLYDWATAMNNSASSDAIPSGIRGVCPEGWHLPSDAEWGALMQSINPDCSATGSCDDAGTKLKATSDWNDYQGVSGNGTDDYGFSALPGGFVNSNGYFYYVGNVGYWWSASEYNSNDAWYRYMSYIYSYVYKGSLSKSFLFSVRCLRD